MRTSPLLVSYQVEGMWNWLDEQLELGNKKMFIIAIENITTNSRNVINSIKYFFFRLTTWSWKKSQKFKLQCEIETNRDLREERQTIALFMRTITIALELNPQWFSWVDLSSCKVMGDLQYRGVMLFIDATNALKSITEFTDSCNL